MTISEKFEAVKRACEKQLVCEVYIKNEPTMRIVQPLGICLTNKRGLVVVCWQIDGYSLKPLPDSYNFSLDDCLHIRSIGRTFQIPEYDVVPEYCQDWLVHVEPQRLLS